MQLNRFGGREETERTGGLGVGVIFFRATPDTLLVLDNQARRHADTMRWIP
jgi:hypothetical protein